MRRQVFCLCLLAPACSTPPPTGSDSNYLAQGHEPGRAECRHARDVERQERGDALPARVHDLEQNAALQAENTRKQSEIDALTTLGNDRANQIAAQSAQIADLSQKLAAQHEQTVQLQDLYLAEKISRLRAERQLLEQKLGND
ncbi:MAG: hypothetical protein U1E76_24735 [Planctomycetota bacterium]